MDRSGVAFRVGLTLLVTTLLIVSSLPLSAGEPSPIETRLTGLIRDFYSEEDEIYVKFMNLPSDLKVRAKVRNVTFIKVPEAGGDGLCAVEIEEKNGRGRTIQVAFRVMAKKRLFVARDGLKKGDVVKAEDLSVKDIYLERTKGYPRSMEDVVGRSLKRDLAEGTVLTTAVLEESFVIPRGELVTIVAENGKLKVQTKGRTLEKGKLGETVRVRNVSSGKEVLAKVTAGNMVTVRF